jgi:hypothetical protein
VLAVALPVLESLIDNAEVGDEARQALGQAQACRPAIAGA